MTNDRSDKYQKESDFRRVRLQGDPRGFGDIAGMNN